MEKFYSSKTLLKLAGGGDASPISFSWIRHCLQQLFKVNLNLDDRNEICLRFLGYAVKKVDVLHQVTYAS